MAKSSKLSGPEQVADFLLHLKHPLKPIMESLREIILGANKNLSEHIKWNAPSFCFQDDDRITFNLHKNDCILIIFHRGAKVKDTKGKEPLFKDTTGLLEWLSSDRGVVKVYSLEEVTEKKAKLLKLVKQWIKETSE
jgi:uncharacterized protein YdhG (YjbR/CyaY superfamily)